MRSIRVEDAEWAAWTERAKQDGLNVSEWIRRICDQTMASVNFTLTVTDNPTGAEVVVPAKGKVRAVTKKRKRTEMCLHRRRPDEFCSRCD